ncbi:DMT family transporter [Pseudomonas sp. CCNWLW23]|uniref:DMT family transporter n=1 Tax=Pseudomonas sp. CCNWLW23 TaxID=3126385 RepID=UPI003012BF5E
MSYLFLLIAVCAEVAATMSLKSVRGLCTPLPLLIVILGYGTSFWMLNLVVRTVPVGIAYAIWAGLGVILVTVGCIYLYDQKVDYPAVIGMSLIILGVCTIQVFSKMQIS